MIDFEQAMRDQEDLDALCSRTSAEGHVESFSKNASYGFARILKDYSGYPADRPVVAVIPHGVYLSPVEMLRSEQGSGLPAVLNYPAYRASVWEREGDGVEVIPSASPFLYALRMFEESGGPPDDPRGVLFFPAHTSGTMRTNASWPEIVDELQGLYPARDVTVCIHPVDYQKGLHESFSSRGMRIVCAGSCWDPEFIYRWLHLALSHAEVVSNDVGSAVLYASAAGLPVRILTTLADHHTAPELRSMRSPDAIREGVEMRRRVVEVFRERAGDGAVVPRDLALYLLGAENFKSPDALREDLEYAASLA